MPAVQDAVKTGAVSVKVAAAVARLPTEEQEQIAAKGPDAMRAAAKSAAKQGLEKVPFSGNSSSPEGVATGNSSSHLAKTQAQEQAEQATQEAYGDSDPVAMLEESMAENDTLRKEIAALESDDQKAETLKWHRIAEVGRRRQDELMDTVNAREKELQRMSNWLRRIGKKIGEDNPSKIMVIVEARFHEQMIDA